MKTGPAGAQRQARRPGGAPLDRRCYLEGGEGAHPGNRRVMLGQKGQQSRDPPGEEQKGTLVSPAGSMNKSTSATREEWVSSGCPQSLRFGFPGIIEGVELGTPREGGSAGRRDRRGSQQQQNLAARVGRGSVCPQQMQLHAEQSVDT